MSKLELMLSKINSLTIKELYDLESKVRVSDSDVYTKSILIDAIHNKLKPTVSFNHIVEVSEFNDVDL